MKKLMWVSTLASSIAFVCAQQPDCPWPGDILCPSDCYPAELLGLEVNCYQPDDFHCCFEVFARFVCRDEPNCLGENCGAISKIPVFTSSPAPWGVCTFDSIGMCVSCARLFIYCGGNQVGTPGGPITVYPHPVCDEGAIIIVPIPVDPTPTLSAQTGGSQ